MNYAGIRFNAPGGRLTVNYWTSVGIILVTPNVGANNVPITVTGIGIEPAERNGTNCPVRLSSGKITSWEC